MRRLEGGIAPPRTQSRPFVVDSRLRDGVLYGADGQRLEIDRPLQLFTRWYGFALTFPGTAIYESEGVESGGGGSSEGS